jgi:hypothetical protein
MAVRWKSVTEPLPADFQARQAAIDTMARSYIAANCSGCHGERGMANPSQNLTTGMNFDFHAYAPRFEFANAAVKTFYLDSIAPDTAKKERPSAHNQFAWLVESAGMATGPGQPWEMILPGSPDQRTPSLLKPGYPALSVILYRQWDRRAPGEDSAATRRLLLTQADFQRDTATARIAKDRLGWIFSRPWGSETWFTLLSGKGITLDSLLAWKYLDFSKLESQMPPLAAFLPDRETQAVLGEWVKHYGSAAGIRPRAQPSAGAGRRDSPLLAHGILRVPAAWGDKASLIRIDGRSLELAAIGPGAFAVPGSASPGIVFFKVGSRHFRLAQL